ncbi:glycoside hydrolase family 28 protein [Piromyces sp. E2]|nr:glycoside hydrolase family 28 protein [Piromyces sp. E2]|eukprot:OUM57378.1 glycoside hydrolase family 28 protein [Piromyces sp. E2]
MTKALNDTKNTNRCIVNPYKKYTKNLPFDMPSVIPPVFPKHDVNVKDFGGVEDGKTLNTEAFAKAIQSLSDMGGGRLVVPAGVWFTGPIVLKSNINLHLEMGAVILFADDENLYPIIETSFEGLNTRRCQSPISAVNETNIAITGFGVIDGNGDYWRPVNREKVSYKQWEEIIARPGGILVNENYWVPSEGFLKGEKGATMNVPNVETEEEWNEIKRFLRPVMVSLRECKNVLLQDVTFQNSPAWSIHPLMCENVIIERIFSRNPVYSKNGDGLDLESCKNALIIDSKFDSGDDGICFKSGKDADGRRRGRPCENVVVSGCTVFKGHGGFVVGSEMSGGIKNIYVKDCQFLNTEVGLRFKSTRGRGGIVENIYIKGITMTDIETDAITFNMFYNGKSVAESLADGDNPDNVKKEPVTEETPIFRNIDIRDVVCQGANRAMEFNGLPEMPISGIHLENIQIIAKNDASFNNYENLTKKNVNIIIKN